jgi:hypothetical protein
MVTAGPGISTLGGDMLRVDRDGKGLADADTIEGARGIVQSEAPGRYECG